MPEHPHDGPEDTHGPRRTDAEAALIAAAASGELSPPERRAYDALVAADPSVAAETAELRAVAGRISRLERWQEATPDAELAARVLTIPDAPVPLEPRRARRTPGTWRGAAAAAVALVVLGGAVGAGLVGLAGGDGTTAEAPPQGPPGTLGAVEPIDFRGVPADVDIDASLVAHTWGTEAVLDMTGFAPGEAFRVVLVAADGGAEGAGTFLGSEVRIDCRLNGALLREDVDVVEIRDDDGRVVASSDVPEATAG